MNRTCSKGHVAFQESHFCHQCGEAIAEAAYRAESAVPKTEVVLLSSGTRLRDRYIIQRVLGQGGFGCTYLALDSNCFNHPVAIKEFMPNQQGTEGLQKAEELFQREARMLYQLQHPQIPRLMETFSENKRIFLVEDFVEGQTYDVLLRERLQQGQTFNEVEVVQLLKGILPVLSYLHDQGVIHRDISLDNIMLRTSDRLPVLIDLGGVKKVAILAATQIGASSFANSVYTFVGKVGFAPEEQLRLGIVAPHSDLYALAVTMIVLLTGRQPQQLISQDTLLWNWHRFVMVHPLLAQVLNQMLAPRPADRFQSAQEVLQALEGFWANHPVAIPLEMNSNQNLPELATRRHGSSDYQIGGLPGALPNTQKVTQVVNQPTSNSLLRGKIWVITAIALLAGGLGLGATFVLPQPTKNKFETPSVATVPSGLFNYGGSTTWAPIREIVDPVIQKAFPQFQLRYTDPTTGTPGSSSGIRMLLANQLSFSQSSRPLKTEEYQAAKKQGFELQQIPVAIDGIAVAVNPSLNIPGLTLSQLKDIYTGKIRNWREVGGPDLAITPFSRQLADGGTVEFFQENVLEDEAFGDNVTYVYGTTMGLRQVAATPGGIYYASAPEVVPQCTIKPLPLGRQADQLVAPYQGSLVTPEQCPKQRNKLNETGFRSGQYPITRRLFVITRKDGQVDQQAGETYANLLLSEDGQKSIAKAGFVPIQ